ncbi:MAG: homoserine kinase, partial [Alphaproteobacteria bacterium]
MAVYTEVGDEDLIAFIAQYDIGEAVSCKGIAEGVENTNYLLQTSEGQYILTLYEKRVNAAELPFFLGLMEHLSAHDVACPVPVHGRDGGALRELCGRPAALVTFLDGMWPRRIKPVHCSELGAALARLHVAGEQYAATRPNALSVESWRPLFESCTDRADSVSAGLGDYLKREIDHLEANWPTDLPSGVCHADLFPDNVFFIGESLSGLIDFYFACNDFYAYDLAICLNAWCFERDNSFNITKARLMVSQY